jgi:hypothetical protein
MATAIGTESHVILCSLTSGSGTSVTYSTAAGEFYQYIKSKEPEINIDFKSKITHSPYHKSRQTPDVKYTQGYAVTQGKFQAKDVNSITEWIVASYIAKKKIYLLVDFWTGSTWAKKSWYNSSNTKVYYCKGILKNLKIKQKSGQIWNISFTFEEVWS